MGCESAAATACPSPMAASPVAASPNGKRSRDPEDEVYLDNFHSQKRYLSEVMASSLNGLSVGESLANNLMESPVRSESICNPRDEISVPCSPMSEDCDEYCDTDTPLHMSVSRPTSPGSPHRRPRSPLRAAPSTPNSHHLPSSTLSSAAASHPRHRGLDSEGRRFPSSPNDVCHTADLRRAALLRSVQMRSQPHCPPAYSLPFSGSEHDDEVEDYMENLSKC